VVVCLSIFLGSGILGRLGIKLAFYSRRTASINVGLCESHHQTRTFVMIVGGGLIALGLGLGVCIAFTWDYGLAPWAIGITLAGAFVLLLKDTIQAKRIDEPYIWVKGVDKRFLSSLPSQFE
jgi:hypothetical protein